MNALRAFFTRFFSRAPDPPPQGKQQRLICKRCGSPDTWRIQDDPGLYADFMRARNLKPFECRMCRYKFYYRAARKPSN